MKEHSSVPNNTNRREFIKSTGTAVIGSTAALTLGFPVPIIGQKKETLKIGLVGCGGRGAGAANDALTADPGVVLYAVADIFEDKVNNALDNLKEIHGKRVQVDKKHQFIGFDAYKGLIDSGVDVVLLATTPAFRPDHIEACIDAGKHVFYEKPVAIDAPGIQKVITASNMARKKNLSMVSGLCFRYDNQAQALFNRVLDGAIGEIKTVSSIRYGGSLSGRVFPKQSGWTDAEYQIRNWYFHNWLSGDFNVEQFVHSHDMISWAMSEVMPVKALGTGGRQARTDKKYGNVYDHFDTTYWYENGVRGFTSTRQQDGTSSMNSVEIAGTLGNAYFERNRRCEITGKNNWVYQGEVNNMFVAEHKALFDSIRNNRAINDMERAANSTMMAILSRMAAYSGKMISWDEAINSDRILGPEMYSRDLKYSGPEIAIPGVTEVL